MKKKNVKNDIDTIKKYLRDSFYNDSDTKYTIKKINKDTNINRDTIKLVIDILKRKKLVTNKYEFKLNLETVEFLETSLRSSQAQKLTGIAIYLAVGSLLVDVIVNSFNISLFWQIILLIYIIILYKYVDTL